MKRLFAHGDGRHAIGYTTQMGTITERRWPSAAVAAASGIEMALIRQWRRRYPAVLGSGRRDHSVLEAVRIALVGHLSAWGVGPRQALTIIGQLATILAAVEQDHAPEPNDAAPLAERATARQAMMDTDWFAVLTRELESREGRSIGFEAGRRLAHVTQCLLSTDGYAEPPHSTLVINLSALWRDVIVKLKASKEAPE